MLQGINHITFAVSNLEKSLHFYEKLLGFTCHAIWNKGAYLTLGNLWFCLSLDDVKPALDYTHISFSVAPQHFLFVKEKLLAANVISWKENRSEGESFYFLDPDGHKLEIHVGDLQSRLASLKEKPYEGLAIKTHLPPTQPDYPQHSE